MTTSSNTTRKPFSFHRYVAVLLPIILMISCSKPGEVNNNSHLPLSHSTEVLDKWMTLQVRLMRNATGIPNHALSRQFAYSGIAALESLAPG